MPRSPNPELQERQAQEWLVNADAGAALDEIVLILQDFLPESIAAENLKRNWNTPATEIPTPKKRDIRLAPRVVTQEEINQVLVSAQMDSFNSTAGSIKNVLNVVVFSIDTCARVEEDFRIHWRRAELIRRDLFPFLNGCWNAEGQKLWSSMIPGPVNQLSGDFHAEFSGMAARFSLTLPQGAN